MSLERKYPGNDSNCGYTFEEMLFAASLTHIDGVPVDSPRDVITLLDEWRHIDAQFALTVFINAVTIDRQEVKDAKHLGKLLLEELSTPEPSTNGNSHSTKRGKTASAVMSTESVPDSMN
jgi:hypothetical protein